MVCDKVVCERQCLTKMVCERCMWQRGCAGWRLPRRTQVAVTKSQFCHAKRKWMSPSATPATQNEGGCDQVPLCQAKRRWMSLSATPATQNQGGCRQVPRLPRETKVDAAKCHACHAKCRGVTGNQNGPKRATRASPVSLMPRLPRKVEVDVAKWHACHVKRKWMPPSATSATQSAATSPATKTGPSAPPEPAQCHKCQACHAKWRWMSPSATPATWKRRCDVAPVARPATQSAAASPATKRAQARHQSQPSAISATPPTQGEVHVAKMVCERWCVKDGCWQRCVWKMVCERWWLTKMVGKDDVWKMVCVCKRWCVKDGVWKMVLTKDVCERWCVTSNIWKMVWKEAGREAAEAEARIENQKQEPRRLGRIASFLTRIVSFFDVVNLKKGGGLAELRSVWCGQLHKMRKSSQKCCVFDVVQLGKMKKSRRIAR